MVKEGLISHCAIAQRPKWAGHKKGPKPMPMAYQAEKSASKMVFHESTLKLGIIKKD